MEKEGKGRDERVGNRPFPYVILVQVYPTRHQSPAAPLIPFSSQVSATFSNQVPSQRQKHKKAEKAETKVWKYDNFISYNRRWARQGKQEKEQDRSLRRYTGDPKRATWTRDKSRRQNNDTQHIMSKLTLIIFTLSLISEAKVACISCSCTNLA